MNLTLHTTTRNGSELVDVHGTVLERRDRTGRLTYANMPNHRRPAGYHDAVDRANRVTV